MTVQSFLHGPGTLTLAPGGGAKELAAQLTKFEVEPTENVTTGDILPVLSGEELRDEDTSSISWKVNGNLVQDLAAAGVVAWTWTHAGETVDFEWVPNTAEERVITGSVRIVPIKLGGDVKKRNTSDFTWACPGDAPELGDVA